MAFRPCFLCHIFLLFLVSATYTELGNAIDVEGCEEVFVGAGWAGVYSFYRRILDDPSRGPKACLFEESWRIGGRTYSVHINHTAIPNFVQDVGAYRFSPDMHLPGDLILHDLGLDTECYAEDCPSAREEMPTFPSDYINPLLRVVDPATRLPAGYVTPILKMVEIAKALGGRVFVQTPLVRLTTTDDDSAAELEFRYAANATAVVHSPSVVVLNLPRNKLFDIEGVETSLEPDTAKILKCNAFEFPPDFQPFKQKKPPCFSPPENVGRDRMAERKFPNALSKAYLYYSDAWWRTVLHKPEGYYPTEFPAVPSSIDYELLFNIRFHDGPVSCDAYGKCHGLLEIYYDESNETIYSSTTDPYSDDPLGSVWETDGPDAVAKLVHIHTGLMDLLHPLFGNVGVDDPHSTIVPPSGLIVGKWNSPDPDLPLGYGYTAPTKVVWEPTVSGSPANLCGVSGLTEITYRDIALQPWGTTLGDTSIFLVNNDWVCESLRNYRGDWAEESLLQAERAMFLLGTPKPAWLDEVYYTLKVESMVGWNVEADRVSDSRQLSVYQLYEFIAVGIVLVVLTIGWNPRKLPFQRSGYTAI